MAPLQPYTGQLGDEWANPLVATLVNPEKLE
jgi:hypothetical protein